MIFRCLKYTIKEMIEFLFNIKRGSAIVLKDLFEK